MGQILYRIHTEFLWYTTAFSFKMSLFFRGRTYFIGCRCVRRAIKNTDRLVGQDIISDDATVDYQRVMKSLARGR